MGKSLDFMAKDLMVDALSVSSNTSVSNTIASMLDNKSKGILVVDDESLQGVVSDFDFIRWLKDEKTHSLDSPISDVIGEKTVYAHPDDMFSHVVCLMFETNTRFVPILSGGKPVGVITMKQLAKIFADFVGRNYKARDLMTYRYSTFSVENSISTFLKRIRQYDDKYSIILSGEDVVGVITPTNILEYMRQNASSDLNTTIRDLMTSNPFIAKPSERCDRIAEVMISKNFSGIPIVKDHLEGIIRHSCFLQFLEV